MKLQRSIWLYQEVCDLGYIKTRVRGFLCIKTAYIIQFLSRAENPGVSKRCLNSRTGKFGGDSPVWTAEGTRESMYISRPLLQPLWTLSELCMQVLFVQTCSDYLYTLKSAPCTSEMYYYYSLFAFLFFHLSNYFEIHLRGVTTPIREHCFVFFLLYKTINSHEEMATMSVYQCNVLQDSVSVCFLFWKRNVIFKGRVLLFAFCVVHTFCLNGPAEQTKLLIFDLIFIFYTIHTCCSRTVTFIFAILTTCPSE